MATNWTIAVCLALFGGPVLAGGWQTDPASDDSHRQDGPQVAYTDVTIETLGPDGQIQQGTLLVRGGVVEAVGSDVKIPGHARQVSLKGKTIMPGLVDPYFVFKKAPAAAPNPNIPAQFRGRFRGTQQQRFTAGPFVTVSDYFYPYTFDFQPAIRSGVTTANLVTDGRGQSALANLQADPTPGMLFETSGPLFAKVTNTTAAIDTVRNGLEPKAAAEGSQGGREAGGGRRGFGRRRQGGESNLSNQQGESDDNQQATQDNQATKTLWTEVREGRRSLIVNVNNAAAVAHVLKLIKKHEKVKLVLVGSGPNLSFSLDDIKKAGVSVVLQPGIDQVPFTTQRMNVAKMIADQKIPFGLSLSLNDSQLKASQDDPLFTVSLLVKTGLKRETALAALTLKPAEMLGIEKTHGSLEKGKSANFLVFDRDPLETGSRLQQVYINGRQVYEN